MQTLSSLGNAVYRIVFRRGSPQRIHFSTRRMLVGGSLMLLAVIGAQLLFLGADALDTGVLVFVLLSGLAIGSALLTWKVPRTRLLPTLLACVLIIACGFTLLSLAGLIPQILGEGLGAALRTGLLLAVGIAMLVGLGNSLQFALKSTTAMAYTYAALFGVAVTLLYTTLTRLLAIVFA